jgi:hypothetical protein
VALILPGQRATAQRMAGANLRANVAMGTPDGHPRVISLIRYKQILWPLPSLLAA